MEVAGKLLFDRRAAWTSSSLVSWLLQASPASFPGPQYLIGASYPVVSHRALVVFGQMLQKPGPAMSGSRAEAQQGGKALPPLAKSYPTDMTSHKGYVPGEQPQLSALFPSPQAAFPVLYPLRCCQCGRAFPKAASPGSALCPMFTAVQSAGKEVSSTKDTTKGAKVQHGQAKAEGPHVLVVSHPPPPRCFGEGL